MNQYENVITTKGLTKEYEKSSGVKNLDLCIKPQEIYGFLGPNGAGKSTTMKMLLGLVHPTAGKIEILGMPFNEQNRIPILKNVGSLIESPSFYGHLTGQENMQVLQKLLDLPKKNIDEAVHIVRMENQMSKKVKHYSLGMKQRLGIAMALARFPKVLILDEPTNGLDPAGIEEIRELICDLPKHYGMTIMISSHLLSEVAQMVTSVGIIDKGELIFQDKFEVLNKYRSPSLFLRTSDNSAAARLLKPWQPRLMKNGILVPMLEDSETAHAVYDLCTNGIRVYRVSTKQRSLEDVFLELTGKEVTL